MRNPVADSSPTREELICKLTYRCFSLYAAVLEEIKQVHGGREKQRSASSSVQSTSLATRSEVGLLSTCC